MSTKAMVRITKKHVLHDLDKIATKIDELKGLTENDYHYAELEMAHESLIKTINNIRAL